MTDTQPVLDQVNIVAFDIDATIAFYRLLGLPVVDPGGDWPPGSGARHIEVEIEGGTSLEFDNVKSASAWNSGARGPSVVIGFALASRDAVDAAYAQLVAAGGTGRQEPYDAFWGARYAIVADLDGNDIGLMSPKDATRRFAPEP